jgi:Ca-activated chloride channel family protein
MKTNSRFTFDALSFEQDNDVHLVVSLTAPKIDWQVKRPRICIVPVIDVSPSMVGEKLEYAKQSVLKLIDHLQPGDYCGVVAFGGQVFVVSKPVEVTQARKDELKAAVGQLGVNGSTNFSGGMCQGLELINGGDLPGGMLMRVVMFTDGQPNTGVAVARPDILKLLEANLGMATLSAFGYGADADQELLADVAKVGKGNYAFIKNPEDALSAFARELGGLLSSYAQNIKVELAPHAGHRITEVISDVDSQESGDHVVVSLPDILSEEVRHLVFAVRVGKQPNAFPRATSVVDVKISYDCLDEKGKKNSQVEELKGKLKFVKAGGESKEPIKEVLDIVGTAILVQKQVEAEVLAKQGNYAGARNVMLSADTDFFIPYRMSNHSTASQAIGSKMENASVYAMSGGFLNSTKLGGTRGVGGSSYDPEAQVLLNTVGTVTSTPAQDAVASSFAVGPVNNGVSGGGVGIHGMVALGGATPYGNYGVQVTGGQIHVGTKGFTAPSGPAAPSPARFTSPKPPAHPPKPPRNPVTKSKSKRW